LAWKLFSIYPQESLSKIPSEINKKYHEKRLDEEDEKDK
jgi:hypothetical protein